MTCSCKLYHHPLRFLCIWIGKGWQWAAGPTIVADGEANSANTWSVPLGIGISKTTKFGNIPWKFTLETRYYVEQPDSFGPEFLLKFKSTPVIQYPFAK